MKKIILYISGFIIFSCITMHAQVSVIANSSVAESKLEATKISNIYSLVTTKWSNGSKIIVIDQTSSADTKEKFYNFIAKDPSSIRKEWLKKQLTGEAKAPETAANDEEVIAKVLSTPGSIGYINSSSVKSGVKVLAEIK